MSVENFSWVIPGKIAGCAVPDFGDPFLSGRDAAGWLAEQGVNVLVSLADPYGPAQEMCRQNGIEWVQFPIRDFGVPKNMGPFCELIDLIVDRMNADKGVCVHCHAGIGRTGLVLACSIGKYLGLPSDQAIATVRKVRMSIETVVQVEFIREFLDGN